jgi:hypothetical protein
MAVSPVGQTVGGRHSILKIDDNIDDNIDYN